jgi:hypothetical protein
MSALNVDGNKDQPDQGVTGAIESIELTEAQIVARLQENWPGAKPVGDGCFSWLDPDDEDGLPIFIDEDGRTVSHPDYRAKADSRLAEQRKKQARETAEGDLRRRRAIRKENKNLVARAKALAAVPDLIDFVDLRRDPDISPAQATAMKAMGQIVPVLPSPSPINLQRFFDALFVGGVIDEVHYDTARRVLVDEEGELINNDEWAARELMEAARAVKLKGLSSEVLLKELKVWALTYKFNDISERVRTHLESLPLDGDEDEEILERFLLDTFVCVDNPDNRLFSKYWCLSLYNRIMRPGCYAPISMVLFGAQDSGKSTFANLLCKELMFDEDMEAVPYDPAGVQKDFLRNISGLSIIANMGEMTGFGKVDLRKWKSFSTSTSDTFDQKFGFSGSWPRQWIFISDSNKYEGLWRDGDDTDVNDESQGERRLFPIFVHEIAGATGTVRWPADSRANIERGEFAERLWRVMKVCDLWMKAHEYDGYKKVVAATTSMVKRFSKAQKDADQGTVHDKTFDEQFPAVIARCIKGRGMITTILIDGEKVKGLRVLASDLQNTYELVVKRQITPQSITKKMKPTGAKKGFAGGGKLKVTAFVFTDPEFVGLAEGTKDRDDVFIRDGNGKVVSVEKEGFVTLFRRLYLSDAPAHENEGKTDEEVEKEGF